MSQTALRIILAIALSATTAYGQSDLPLLLSTVAGVADPLPGITRYTGDGIPATESGLHFPIGLFLGDDGELLIADTFNNRVRTVSPDGIIGTALVLGSAMDPFSGAVLEPTAVGKDPAGNIHVADFVNNRIRVVSPTGEISVLAGRIQWIDQDPFYGDNGPASEASLNGARSIAIDPNDIVYVADTFNNRIRRVTAGDFISTYAGSADRGFAGDGGKATEAWLNNPKDVFLVPGDGIYIADSLNNRIRKVDRNSIITTVAGSGKHGYNGDGIPATLADMREPRGIFVDGEGNLYISDSGNHRIRKVDTNGIITTVIGSGRRGRSEDGVRATEAFLHTPEDVILDPNGNILFSDSYNHQIRMASPMRFWLRVTY